MVLKKNNNGIKVVFEDQALNLFQIEWHPKTGPKSGFQVSFKNLTIDSQTSTENITFEYTTSPVSPLNSTL